MFFCSGCFVNVLFIFPVLWQRMAMEMRSLFCANACATIAVTALLLVLGGACSRGELSPGPASVPGETLTPGNAPAPANQLQSDAEFSPGALSGGKTAGAHDNGDTQSHAQDVLARVEGAIARAAEDTETPRGPSWPQAGTVEFRQLEKARLTAVRETFDALQAHVRCWESEQGSTPNAPYMALLAETLACVDGALQRAAPELSARRAMAAQQHLDAGEVCLRRWFAERPDAPHCPWKEMP